MQINATTFMALGSLLCSLTFTPSASAIAYDFEDLSLDGWAQSNSGGAATFEVVDKNGSSRAHVGHVSNTTTGDQSSLSRTFNYVPTDVLSFEMEALAFLSQYGSRVRHGLAGVQVSFLNNFNVPIGAASLFNVTSSSLLGPNDSSIASTQESYSATMAEFAALAGLDDSAPIAKMSLSFLARGYFSSGGNIYPDVRSGGNVWVDNVSVGLSRICGDADGNGSVSVTDGVQVLRAAAGLSSRCAMNAAACDIDGSGTITVTDGVNVLRLAAGLPVDLHCPF
jgi:hypothetical protein